MQAVNIRQLKSNRSTELAVSLFHSGAVSAGFAARVAGKPLAEMLTLLFSQGIPLAGESKAGEVREEMRRACDWLAS